MLLADVDISKEWKLAQNFPTLASLVSSILPNALLLGGVICFIIVVITGFGVVTGAGGDEHAAEGRKNILTYAIIGLTIMFGAYWVLQIINFITKGSLGNILGS